MIHYLMQVICAWCGADLGTKPGRDGVSHGMCSACKAEFDRQLEEMKKGKGGK